MFSSPSLIGYYTARFRPNLMNGNVIEFIHIAEKKETKAALLLSKFVSIISYHFKNMWKKKEHCFFYVKINK
jgi:hypothetical protein